MLYQEALRRFIESGVPRPTLGLVYGRRRIGKSTLLTKLVNEAGGFSWEATRTEPAVLLARLGAALGEHQGVGTLAFGTWEEAVAALLRLGEQEQMPVLVDEFGHVLEADPSVPSIVAAGLGPGGRRGGGGRARLTCAARRSR